MSIDITAKFGFLIFCVGLLLVTSIGKSSSISLTKNVHYVQAQDFPVTSGEEQLCLNGFPPDPTTNLCPDENPPLANLTSEFSQDVSPEVQLPDGELSATNETLTGFETPAANGTRQGLLCSDGLPPYSDGTCPGGGIPQANNGEGPAGSPPGAVTGEETLGGLDQQLPILPEGASTVQTPEEVQKDTNNDGVVDEFESQIQGGSGSGAGDTGTNQSTSGGGSGGQPQTAVTEPFVEQAYGPQMIFDPARSKDLTDAITAVRGTLSQQDKQRLDRVSFVIAKLGTGNNPVEYAGVKENDMFTAGSLLKVSLLYTSFELPSRLNKLAPTVAWNWEPFFSAVMSAVPSIPDGKEKKMKVDEVVKITGTSDAGVLSFDLNPQHLSDLERIFMDQNQNDSPRTVIHRLGYGWINGALAAGGFLDLNTKKGIWYATDIGGGWNKFFANVATNGKSSSATTALAMANLMTAMHHGTLIDNASSKKMIDIMATGGSWLSVLDPAIQSSFSFVSKGAKVGVDDGSNANSGIVKSEGLFLEHDGQTFVAVWLNSPGSTGADIKRDIPSIYKVIDEVVKKWP